MLYVYSLGFIVFLLPYIFRALSSIIYLYISQFSCSVMSDFATLWTAAHEASLSVTNSRSLLNLMSIDFGDAIEPSHPLSPASPPAFNLSQHQGIFQGFSSSYQEARVLEFQLQHQSFQ